MAKKRLLAVAVAAVLLAVFVSRPSPEAAPSRSSEILSDSTDQTPQRSVSLQPSPLRSPPQSAEPPESMPAPGLFDWLAVYPRALALE